MKKIIFIPLILALLACQNMFAQIGPSNAVALQVSGSYLLGTCGDSIRLKGVNYAATGWGWSAAENYFPEIAQTGANCVRIVWYANDGSPQYTFANLDSALARCVRHKMIPIFELHDATCNSNMSVVSGLLSFYNSTPFLSLEQKYRKHLIINFANEAGFYQWSGDPAAALSTYASTYTSMISTLRTAGVKVPFMIDAPDCGTNSDAFVQVAPSIVSDDPLQNVLFSVHSYWYAFTGNDIINMTDKIIPLANAGVCVVFGEIANFQDDNSPCTYSLNYQQLLPVLDNYGMGWIAWGWTADVCAQRQLSTNGSFSSLSPYGQSIVNDPNFGLATHAVRALQLTNPQICWFTGIEENQPLQTTAYTLFPNPAQDQVSISGAAIKGYQIMTASGQLIRSEKGNQTTISIKDLSAGIYILAIENEQSHIQYQRFSKQ
jgi:mannan endo-1,4-beta-mannosidase